MPRYRNVAGVGRVQFTPAEEAARDAEEALQAGPDSWRTTAKLTKAEFLIALKRAGILPGNEAKLAAKGEWPATFTAALSGLPIDPDEAEIIWSAATVVDRLDPLLLALQAHASLTDAQVDALFGWAA